jgi:hypothetical protein
MMDRNLYDKYTAQLLALETPIAHTYDRHPDLTDHQVDEVVNNLVRVYSGKRPIARLNEAQTALYESLKTAGDGQLTADFTSETLLGCLKLIRHSIQFWTKEGGRQGYLEYMSQFIPPSG